MNIKHLDGTGKGEFVYDTEHDILMFKIRDRDYKMSTEFQNFVVDIDDESFVTGIRIFDASKVFDTDKEILKNISSWKFKSSVENNTLTITFKFVSKAPEPSENFTQQMIAPLNGYHLVDSLVECAAA